MPSMTEGVPEYRKAEIIVPMIFDPADPFYRDYARNIGEIYIKQISDREFKEGLEDEIIPNGAAILASESIEVENELRKELDLFRFLGASTRFRMATDVIEETETMSLMLLADGDNDSSRFAASFLQSRMLAWSSKYLADNYGPDFTETYWHMLNSSVQVIHNTIIERRNAPSTRSIYTNLDDNLEQEIKNRLIDGNDNLVAKFFDNNLYLLIKGIHQYNDSRNKGSIGVIEMLSPKRYMKNFPNDVPNLDLSFFKFFEKYEDEIMDSGKLDAFSDKHLNLFKRAASSLIRIREYDRSATEFRTPEEAINEAQRLAINKQTSEGENIIFLQQRSTKNADLDNPPSA